MADKKSDLPVTTRDLTRADQAIEKIRTPEEAEEVKAWLKTIQGLYEKRGLFEQGYKASDFWVQADKKFWKLIGQSGLSEGALAKALHTTKSALQSLRHDLKRAYDKPEEVFEELKQKAFEKKEYLTRYPGDFLCDIVGT